MKVTMIGEVSIGDKVYQDGTTYDVPDNIAKMFFEVGWAMIPRPFKELKKPEKEVEEHRVEKKT